MILNSLSLLVHSVRNLFLTDPDTSILGGIGEVIQAVFGWIANIFTSVTGIFYSSSTGFTFPGVLLLVAFGLTMVWVVINFIKSLVKRG